METQLPIRRFPGITSHHIVNSRTDQPNGFTTIPIQRIKQIPRWCFPPDPFFSSTPLTSTVSLKLSCSILSSRTPKEGTFRHYLLWCSGILRLVTTEVSSAWALSVQTNNQQMSPRVTEITIAVASSVPVTIRLKEHLHNPATHKFHFRLLAFRCQNSKSSTGATTSQEGWNIKLSNLTWHFGNPWAKQVWLSKTLG